MTDEKKLSVAYAADDNYAKYLGISMLSLFRSNEGFEEIEVFVLDCGILEENKNKLESIARQYCRTIGFISMERAVSSLDLHMGARKISIASYARLFLASILPKSCTRVLYLDCDTIVRGKIDELWNADLEGYLVAGVRDTVDSFFLKKIGLDKEEYYVNAGILLIDLEGWRSEGLEQRFTEFIRQFDGNVPHHDQGTINGVCRKRKLAVKPGFNATSNIYSFSAKTIRRIYFMESFYSQEELDEAKSNPAILHFTTGLVGRPWEENCTHPMKEEYFKAAAISPWKEDPLLPDGRKPSVKAFSWFYRHMPLVLSEAAYRSVCWLSHIRE
ncbi:glycosyltransferase family 8 protein [Kineothrix sedimenti]|uniref:Glycosyltransferase family 8 protein n=1 Tax=Kineothrix sedimenti TaxID=3123317 RepID=A0ABZ3EXE8_9FIRM